MVDGFRNYVDDRFEDVTGGKLAPEQMFLDRANLLGLSAPEWAVLTAGLRTLGANWDGSDTGVLTDRVGTLSNDFFTVVTSMDYDWSKTDEAGHGFVLRDRNSGEQRYTASRLDLIFGANSQLRAISEVYAASTGEARFVRDFVRVWNKVMMADRYDTHQ